MGDPLPDLHIVSQFEERWQIECHGLRDEERHRIGVAYIEQIKGLSPEIAERFAQNDTAAFVLVGEAPTRKNRFAMEMFWREVFAVLPLRYSEDDLHFLLDKGGIEAIYALLHVIITYTDGGPFFDALQANWHVYK